MSYGPMTPTATVVLPVYNAGQYLDSAIDSVLGQRFTDFELLLLNDGSTDSSLDRLKYFANLDSRCKVYSWPNRGLVGTLNEGVRLARTDILIRMDADDICHPDRFGAQVSYLQEHPECVAVGARVMLIDSEGQPICQFAKQTRHEAIDSEHLAGRGGAIAHPASAMRKGVVVAVGAYRAEFPHAEDIDLFLRLAEVGRLANLREVLLYYRQHANSIGYQHAKTQRDSAMRAVAAARERRNLAPELVADDRDTNDREVTLSDIHRKWAWWALADHNVATARKHAAKAIRSNPFSMANLKLLACVLRGH